MYHLTSSGIEGEVLCVRKIVATAAIPSVVVSHYVQAILIVRCSATKMLKLPTLYSAVIKILIRIIWNN